MQNDSNLSTAVLTPHLNHPNFSNGSDYCKRCNYAHKKRKSTLSPKPLSEQERKARIRWSQNQTENIAKIPSNAVLGVDL